MDAQLASWRDGPAKAAIVDFVDRVTSAGGDQFVPPEQRIAVFDNDGTLWCEQPMPVELGFILQRLAAMAAQDASLRDRQPFQAAYQQDHQWLGQAITKHYQGDDGDVKLLMGGVLSAFAGQSVEQYQAAAGEFLRAGRHPTLHRRFLDCGYLPMRELLRYLAANGFTTFIATGGDRDFLRPVAHQLYGVPPERVIGSSSALRYQPGTSDRPGGSIVYQAEPDVFDDGPAKPVRIWSRIGRRPILAAGNANGDIPMLEFTGGPSLPGLRLLLRHDDAEREFDYTAGAEQALTRADTEGWTVVSVTRDWQDVFPAAG